MWPTGLVALGQVGASQARDGARVPWISRWVSHLLYHQESLWLPSCQGWILVRFTAGGPMAEGGILHHT